MRVPSVGLAGLVVVMQLARAQTAPDSTRVSRRWTVGASVGVPGYRDEAAPELFTLGLNFTQIATGHLGADFAVGTMPRAFTSGAFVVGARGGVVLPLSVGPTMVLLPSAGASLLGAATAEGGGGIRGINAGVAMIRWTETIGVRTGMTWHHFENANGAIWLFEVGLTSAR